jgi:hypothetical protein
LADKSVVIYGLDDLFARLRLITEGMTTAEASRVYLNAARGVQRQVRSAVPRGNRRMYFSLYGFKKRQAQPGQMKKSVVAMIPKRRQRRQIGGPAAIAAIVQKKRRVIGAPHIHWLTYGGGRRKSPKNRLMAFPNYRQRGKRNTGFSFAYSVAGMKPNPQIPAAFRSASSRALNQALLASKRIMDRAIAKQSAA